MLAVRNVYLSDDIATAKFACHLSVCKGNCCVRGDAGAPVKKTEVPVLNKMWKMLSPELADEAVTEVKKNGLIRGNGENLELATVDGAECVFVEYDDSGVALCSIQRAYYENKTGWEKPLSCHLYPLRVLKSGNSDYVNFEYIPDMCSPACDRGEDENIFLAEFLEAPLTRAYGPEWYREFLRMCREIRVQEGMTV